MTATAPPSSRARCPEREKEAVTQLPDERRQLHRASLPADIQPPRRFRRQPALPGQRRPRCILGHVVRVPPPQARRSPDRPSLRAKHAGSSQPSVGSLGAPAGVRATTTPMVPRAELSPAAGMAGSGGVAVRDTRRRWAGAERLRLSAAPCPGCQR